MTTLIDVRSQRSFHPSCIGTFHAILVAAITTLLVNNLLIRPRLAIAQNQQSTSGQNATETARPGENVSITGKVVDEQGQAVGNVEVQYFGPDTGTVTTNADGTFHLTWRNPPRAYERLLLAKEAGGHRQGWVGFPNLKMPQPLILTLKPAHEVKLTVNDALSRPVQGAKVAALGGVGSFCLATGQTDADGEAVLVVPNDAVAFIVASKPGAGFDYFTPQTVPYVREFKPLPDKMNLTLNGARTVHINAVDSAGQPIAAVRFAVWGFRKQGQPIEIGLRSYDALTAVTDKAGTATFDWLPQDQAFIQFECQATDRAVPKRPGLLTVSDIKTEELTVPVLRFSRLTGHVYLPDGKPAARAHVRAEGFIVQGAVSQSGTNTNSDGSYEMLLPSEQAYLVSVESNRWSSPVQGAVVVHENDLLAPVDFQLTEGTLLKGTVTAGEDHRPLAQCRLTLTISKGEVPPELSKLLSGGEHLKLQFSRYGQTDDHGQFQFHVGPGEWSIQVGDSTVGREPLVENVAIDAQPEVIKDFNFGPSIGGQLKGLVLNADGQPLDGVWVTATYLQKPDEGSLTGPTARTDRQGKFEMVRQSAPTVLMVRNAKMELAYVSIDAKQTDATIHFAPPAKAHGRLVDDNGEIVTTGVIVYSSHLSADADQKINRFQLTGDITKPDTDGQFTLSGLLPQVDCNVFYGSTELEAMQMSARGQRLTVVTPAESGVIELGSVKIPRLGMVRLSFKHQKENEAELYWNDQRVASDDDLFKRLAQIPDARICEIVISADKDVAYDQITHVLDCLAARKIKQIVLPNQYAEFDFVVRRAVGTPAQINLGLPKQLGDQLTKIKGVQRVVAELNDFLTGTDKEKEGDGLSSSLVVGWPTDSPLMSKIKILPGGRVLAADDQRKVIVGREFAKKIDRTVGDSIRLYNGERFEIVGVYFSKNLFEYHGLIIPLADLQRLMNKPGEVHAFNVIAEPSLDDRGLNELRKRLAAVQPGLEVIRTTRREEKPADPSP